MSRSLVISLRYSWIFFALFGLFTWIEPARVRADNLPDSAAIDGVLGHPQSYVLSCESRSAVDWAAFWGISLSESEFQEALPRSDDPDEGFVGSPNDAWGSIPPYGYGVHADPVAALLRDYGLEAEAKHNLSWDDLRAEIAAGRPVIVWVISQMWNGRPIEYTASNGDTTTVAHYEHTMILIGYTEDSVTVLDAYTGWTQYYGVETFLTSWSVLGNMAVVGGGEEQPVAEPTPAQQPQPASTEGESYVVQRGDFLTALAEQFNTTWEKLATINSIPFPYTIYTGQVLKLPGEVSPAPEPVPAESPPDFAVYLPLVFGSGGSAALNPEPTPVIEAVPTPEDDDSLPEIYIVQRGDFLAAIAERFDLDWRELALVNNLPYPYVIYAGQELRLK